MLPETSRQMAKQCILDALGCSIRGSLEAPGQIVQRIVARQGGEKESTVFCAQPFQTTALHAALANGAFNHLLYYVSFSGARGLYRRILNFRR